MKIFNIENYKDFENIFNDNNNDYVIVNISATWCKPCNNIKEELNDFINKLDIENSVFLKIDYDLIENDDDFMKFFEINKIPYFYIYKDKSKIKEFQTGDIDIIKNEINTTIENNMNNSFSLSNDF